MKLEEAIANGKIAVNLGAGLQAYEHPGYIAVDKLDLPGIDYVWNCDDGLPRVVIIPWEKSENLFADNTVDEFLCHHFCEHLSADGFMQLMDDMWDALKPNGLLHIYVPNCEHPRAAHGDPTHKKQFHVTTFDYFTPETLAAFPYTQKAWRIDEGYPVINGVAPSDLWEIEVKMRPIK